jgi:tRNA threonylcarbamoyladenosine biosynthesis protein TsaE
VDTCLDLASRRDTLRLGSRIADALRPGDLASFQGELGAGKTFLARAVLRALGVKRDLAIASPTFAIVHEYVTAKAPVLHADFYRLLDGRSPLAEEIARLGLREQRAEGAILIAEWAQVNEAALGGAPELVVVLEIRGEYARHARISGIRAEAIL